MHKHLEQDPYALRDENVALLREYFELDRLDRDGKMPLDQAQDWLRRWDIFRTRRDQHMEAVDRAAADLPPSMRID